MAYSLSYGMSLWFEFIFRQKNNTHKFAQKGKVTSLFKMIQSYNNSISYPECTVIAGKYLGQFSSKLK